MSFAAWDTAGQERFRSLASALFVLSALILLELLLISLLYSYRGADSCILVYDATAPAEQILASLRSWFNEFILRCPISEESIRDFPFIVVGNKVDLLPGGAAKAVEGATRAAVGKLLRELVPPLPPLPSSKPAPTNGHTTESSPSDNCHSSSANQKPPPAPQVIPPQPAHLPPSHLSTLRQQKHLSADPSEVIGTMRTARSSMTTTQTIYHTPSSSYQDSSLLSRGDDSSGNSFMSEGTIRVDGGTLADTDEERGEGEDLDDDGGDGGEYFVNDEETSQRERDRERENGIDIFMASSPPRPPIGLLPSTNSSFNYRNPNERLLRRPSGLRMGGYSTNGRISKSPHEAEEEILEEERRKKEEEENTKYERDGIKHFYSSAKSGEGVDEIFEYVVKRVLAKWRKEEIADRDAFIGSTIRIGDGREKKKSWSDICC